MTKNKRIVICCLIFLAILFSFCCCGKKTDDMSGETVDGSNEDKFVPDSYGEINVFSDGTRYDGYDFIILARGSYDNNDFSSSFSADKIEKAKYDRIEYIREKYGANVVCDCYIEAVGAGDLGGGYQKLKVMYESKVASYDMALISTMDAAYAACGGYLADLNSDAFSCFDFSRPWYDQNAVEALSIGKSLFYTSGDITLTDNYVTGCVLVNKDVIRQTASMKDPYELVKEGVWTLDVFKTEVKAGSFDSDGIRGFGDNDRCGLLTFDNAVLFSFACSGARVARMDSDKMIELTLNEKRCEDAVRSYFELAFDDSFCFNYQTLEYPYWDEVTFGMTQNARAAYYMTTFGRALEYIGVSDSLGVLPMPKYDDESSYAHYVSSYYGQMMCVPYYFQDGKRTSGIIEALSYDGKRFLGSSFYDKMTLRDGTYDGNSYNMMEIIFSSRVYDVGMVYGLGNYELRISHLSKNTNGDFYEMYDQGKDKANERIKYINDSLRRLVG